MIITKIKEFFMAKRTADTIREEIEEAKELLKKLKAELAEKEADEDAEEEKPSKKVKSAKKSPKKDDDEDEDEDDSKEYFAIKFSSKTDDRCEDDPIELGSKVAGKYKNEDNFYVFDSEKKAKRAIELSKLAERKRDPKTKEVRYEATKAFFTYVEKNKVKFD